MLTPVRSGQFKRDVRKSGKRGMDMGKLRVLLSLLIEQRSLPGRYKDHPLKGQWIGSRDVHIGPDWLLIYRVEDDELKLVRIGTHADLFDE